jgi:EAL domain-containing protein (putative c-di-GMP-specific phosphodiesterase class I)
MLRSKSVGGARTTMFESDAALTVTTLADELAFAVSHGLIRPHVQPVVDLETEALVGYQGLARWAHPRHGMLEADQFVHLVAGTPILPVIDLAVLRRTAAAAARSARSGLPIHAYGHVSRRLLGDAGAERYLVEIIDDLGVAPCNLCIEVAHAVVARPSRTIESALRTLREIGVRLVLSGVDGECDVNQIVAYGFDELRLDRRLVRDAARDAVRRRLAHGTIALARALGLVVIAVGVESEAERDQMLEAGCDYGEGLLFGPVQPAGAVD